MNGIVTFIVDIYLNGGCVKSRIKSKILPENRTKNLPYRLRTLHVPT